MAVLSLPEAAEQAATSKLDVWRAIRDGALPAVRTGDGGYAIEPGDLFRVFEREQPEPPSTPPAMTPTTEPAAVGKADGRPGPAKADDVAVAFAALQAELRSLLGLPRGSRRRRLGQAARRARSRPDDLAEQDGHPAGDRAAEEAERGSGDGDATAAGEPPAPAKTRRLWWRRLTRSAPT